MLDQNPRHADERSRPETSDPGRLQRRISLLGPQLPLSAARVRLVRELAATGEPLVATHLSFPSVCRVAVAGDAFRCVPAVRDY